MATIVYLDTEDEITTAASRIRGAGTPRVGLFVPFGSRVSTSRINFRLLAREALEAGRRLDILAPDASARALAASAGLPVFASVVEYEAALEGGEAAGAAGAAGLAAAGTPVEQAAKPSRPSVRDAAAMRAIAAAAAGSAAADAAGGPADATLPGSSGAAADDTFQLSPREVAASPAGAGRASAKHVPTSRPPEADPYTAAQRHRSRRWALVALAVVVLLLALGAGAAAAATMLPSAEITLTPVLEPVTPASLTVRADVTATSVDPAGMVIPATAVQVPLTASGDFPATGTYVQQTSASGQVTFNSINTVFAVPVARGTQLSTGSGVVFATTAAVNVPRATVSGTTITRGRATVGVVAVTAGPGGNVPAQAIDQVPSSLAAAQVSVANPAPTAGGTRTVQPKINPGDVTAAADKLSKDLASQVGTAASDPALAPQGTTLFPGTAKLGAVTYSPDSGSLAGKVLKSSQTTFHLQAAASATVTAIDESPLKALGESAVRAAVTPGSQIVDGSIVVTVSGGTVGEDGTVSYTISATALEHRPLDAAALTSSVLGKSPADAEAALAPYGKAQVGLWPFWVTSVPTSPDHVTLTIAAPVARAPSAAPQPTPTPRPASSARPSGSAAPSQPGASGVPSEAPAGSAPPSAAPSGAGGPAPSGSPIPST